MAIFFYFSRSKLRRLMNQTTILTGEHGIPLAESDRRWTSHCRFSQRQASGPHHYRGKIHRIQPGEYWWAEESQGRASGIGWTSPVCAHNNTLGVVMHHLKIFDFRGEKIPVSRNITGTHYEGAGTGRRMSYWGLSSAGPNNFPSIPFVQDPENWSKTTPRSTEVWTPL